MAMEKPQRQPGNAVAFKRPHPPTPHQVAEALTSVARFANQQRSPRPPRPKAKLRTRPKNQAEPAQKRFLPEDSAGATHLENVKVINRRSVCNAQIS